MGAFGSNPGRDTYNPEIVLGFLQSFKAKARIIFRLGHDHFLQNHFQFIKTTSFIPPSVIKLHLLSAHAFTCFGFFSKPSSEGPSTF
jgi:hypothetical protein